MWENKKEDGRKSDYETTRFLVQQINKGKNLKDLDTSIC